MWRDSELQMGGGNGVRMHGCSRNVSYLVLDFEDGLSQGNLNLPFYRRRIARVSAEPIFMYVIPYALFGLWSYWKVGRTDWLIKAEIVSVLKRKNFRTYFFLLPNSSYEILTVLILYSPLTIDHLASYIYFSICLDCLPVCCSVSCGIGSMDWSKMHEVRLQDLLVGISYLSSGLETNSLNAAVVLKPTWTSGPDSCCWAASQVLEY